MPLTAREIAEFERRLRIAQTEILRETRADVVRERDETFADLAGAVRDVGDEAVADLLADLGHAEVDRDLRQLRAIEAALERIASGRYGRCEDCGADIERERLEVAPAAARCAPCQHVYERLHAPGGARL